MEKFKQGVQYVNIASAVTKDELTSLDEIDSDYGKLSKLKFIPASGAATRMFKDLYAYLEDEETTDLVDHFFDRLEDFAFYEDLNECVDMYKLDKDNLEDRILIIKALLNNEMNYGILTKALIKFHQYNEKCVTPIDEHIFEGKNYLDADDMNLHFTISEEDEALFNEYVEKATEGKENINITYSFQKKMTDTVAADMNNEPFVLENGEVLYRPGGHGALIENLNDLKEDIIFIKNIDNVCHRSRVEETIDSKKKLASIGMEVKKQIDGYVSDLLSDHFD